MTDIAKDPDLSEYEWVIYDNPHTYCREYYDSGKMCASIDSALLSIVPQIKHVIPWKSNRCLGYRRPK